MRGFEVAKGYENKEIKLPRRGTLKSAGYDFEICMDMDVKPHEVVLAPTGVKAYMNDDEVLKLYARSSLAVKRGLQLPNGVGIIDADYYQNPKNDGAIFVALYNFSDKVVQLKKGERIAQGIFVKYLTASEDKVMNQTRSGGFGSTGHK